MMNTQSQQKKAFLLSQSLQFLDEDMIAEAHEEEAKKASVLRHSRIIRRIALVASICLLTVSVPLLLRFVLDTENKAAGSDMMGNLSPEHDYVVNGNTPSQDNEDKNDFFNDSVQSADRVYVLGDTAESSFGTLTYMEETQTTITLRMTLTKPATQALHMAFFDNEKILTATQSGVGIYDEPLFTMSVNGQTTNDALPTEAGVYDIIIDFSALIEKQDIHLQGFIVTSFHPMQLWSGPDTVTS